MADEVKDLVVQSSFIVPSFDDDMVEAMAEELEGLSVSFDRAKIPSGGGMAFEVPGDDPDNPDMTKELVGVIVDHYPINAYWKDKFSGQNNPPDCMSIDGKTGVGINEGNCQSCPMNQYGSDEGGKGKACKNMHRVYLLRSGEMLPVLLTLPPTSIKAFSNYLAKRVLTKGRKSYGVITKVTLKKDVNSTGIPYSSAQFAISEVLDAPTVKQMKEFADNIKKTTREVKIQQTDYVQAEDGAPF